jgi:hypothetical protein
MGSVAMIRHIPCPLPRKPRMPSPRAEDGSIIVIVMVFALVFLGMGVALFSLTKSSITGTDTERKEVKAFNVAEAGIDAGMLALKQSWPEATGQTATVDSTAVRQEFPAATFPNPTRTGQQFISVSIYDDSKDGNGVPYTYDQNQNHKMWVDSWGNVSNDRHRIMILAERSKWCLQFPMVAMFAGSAGANGHGLSVGRDPDDHSLLPLNGGTEVGAYYGAAFDKGVEPISPVVNKTSGSAGTFRNWVPRSLRGALKTIAQNKGTFFTDANAADAFLQSAQAPGSVVYVDLTSVGAGTVTMGGNNQIGTLQDPVVLVLEGAVDQNGVSQLEIDWRGTADFYGIVIADASAMNRGAATFHGSVICAGAMTGKGNGSTDILYNGDLIKKINGAYTISVNIVPNTWEEYTVQ